METWIEKAVDRAHTMGYIYGKNMEGMRYCIQDEYEKEKSKEKAIRQKKRERIIEFIFWTPTILAVLWITFCAIMGIMV